MRRKASLSHEKLVEEARFVLKNLQRRDVFGDRVQLAEVERVLAPSLSVGFHDFVGFLTKYGYARLDADRTITVTTGGVAASEAEDAEFHGRLARHFARELTAAAGRPRSEPSAPPPLSTFDASPSVTSVVRTRRPLAPETPSSGKEVLDRRYRRGSKVGSGAFGVVYRGRHVGIGRSIAIKEARTVFQFASYLRRDEIIRRLRKAVEAHAQLAHPYVIQLLDQNTEREHPYVVMELATGGNLRQRLQASEKSKLPLTIAVRALTQVAHALNYGHSQGVLHLGLKPENVLFDHLGNVKLSDFGMGRILDHLEDGGPAPVLVGGSTVGYFAPERLQPVGATLGPSADIYALGILFYEMITGRLPGRRSPLPSQAAEGVPEAFDDVFDRMTRDALDERYPDLDAVLDGIYEAFGPELIFEKGSALSWTEDPGPVPYYPSENGHAEQAESLTTGELQPISFDDDEPLDGGSDRLVVPDPSQDLQDIPPSAREPSRPPPPPPPDE